MNKHIYPVIMAGGSGTRFWPMSRENMPKQCLSLLGKNSMVKETFDKLKKLAPANNILISTNSKLAKIMQNQLKIKDKNYVLEPIARNTAPCIGLTLCHVLERDPEAIVAIVPSDHIIKDNISFIKHLKVAVDIAERKKAIALIGITPLFPNTGLGYIHLGNQAYNKNKIKGFRVQGFREKPNYEVAMEYVSSGNYLWNAGMFVAKASVLMEEIRKYMPPLYLLLKKISDSKLNPKMIEKAFMNMNESCITSIDFGVMEKSQNLIVVKGEFDWNDVGDWKSIQLSLKKDEKNNIVMGDKKKILFFDTTETIVKSDRLVAAIGVENLVIIDSPDALLICHKEKSQDVKKIVDALKKDKELKKYA